VITAISGYVLKCEECKVIRSEVGFDLQMMYMWANGYGTAIRIACARCGSVHDVKMLKSETGPIITKRNFKSMAYMEKMKAAITERQAVDQAIAEEWTE